MSHKLIKVNYSSLPVALLEKDSNAMTTHLEAFPLDAAQVQWKGKGGIRVAGS